MPEFAIVTDLSPTGVPNTGLNELTVLIGEEKAVATVPGLCKLTKYDVVVVNYELNDLYRPPVNEVTAINSPTCAGKCKVSDHCGIYMNQIAAQN